MNEPISVRFGSVEVPRGQIFRLSDEQLYVSIPDTATRSLVEIHVGGRIARTSDTVERLVLPRIVPSVTRLGPDSSSRVRLVGKDTGGDDRDLAPYLWTIAPASDVASDDAALHDHGSGDPHRILGLTIDDEGRIRTTRPAAGQYVIVAHVGNTHATASVIVESQGGSR